MNNTKIRRKRESPFLAEWMCGQEHVFLNFFHLVEPQPVVVGYSRRPVIRTYCAAV